MVYSGCMESLETEVCTDLEKRDDRGRGRGCGRGCGRGLLKKEHWSSLMSAYDASGLTQVAFARREGINYHTFMGWLARRRRELKQPEPERMDAESRAATRTHFQELTLKPQPQIETAAYALEVSLPCGTLLRGQDAGSLAGLVSALK